jgi:hypothetical protein
VPTKLSVSHDRHRDRWERTWVAAATVVPPDFSSSRELFQR